MISSEWSDPISSPALFYNTLTTVSSSSCSTLAVCSVAQSEALHLMCTQTRRHTHRVRLIVLWCSRIWELGIVWTSVSRSLGIVWLLHRRYRGGTINSRWVSSYLIVVIVCMCLCQSLCSRSLIGCTETEPSSNYDGHCLICLTGFTVGSTLLFIHSKPCD